MIKSIVVAYLKYIRATFFQIDEALSLCELVFGKRARSAIILSIFSIFLVTKGYSTSSQVIYVDFREMQRLEKPSISFGDILRKEVYRDYRGLLNLDSNTYDFLTNNELSVFWSALQTNSYKSCADMHTWLEQYTSLCYTKIIFCKRAFKNVLDYNSTFTHALLRLPSVPTAVVMPPSLPAPLTVASSMTPALPTEPSIIRDSSTTPSQPVIQETGIDSSVAGTDDGVMPDGSPLEMKVYDSPNRKSQALESAIKRPSTKDKKKPIKKSKSESLDASALKRHDEISAVGTEASVSDPHQEIMDAVFGLHKLEEKTPEEEVEEESEEYVAEMDISEEETEKDKPFSELSEAHQKKLTKIIQEIKTKKSPSPAISQNIEKIIIIMLSPQYQQLCEKVKKEKNSGSLDILNKILKIHKFLLEQAINFIQPYLETIRPTKGRVGALYRLNLNKNTSRENPILHTPDPIEIDPAFKNLGSIDLKFFQEIKDKKQNFIRTMRKKVDLKDTEVWKVMNYMLSDEYGMLCTVSFSTGSVGIIAGGTSLDHGIVEIILKILQPYLIVLREGQKKTSTVYKLSLNKASEEKKLENTYRDNVFKSALTIINDEAFWDKVLPKEISQEETAARIEIIKFLCSAAYNQKMKKKALSTMEIIKRKLSAYEAFTSSTLKVLSLSKYLVLTHPVRKIYAWSDEMKKIISSRPA